MKTGIKIVYRGSVPTGGPLPILKNSQVDRTAIEICNVSRKFADGQYANNGKLTSTISMIKIM